MLNCKETSQLVSQSLARPLTWTERFKVKLHLIICKYCRRFQQQIVLIKSALKTNVKQTENDLQHTLSTTAKERITQVLNAFL